MSDPSKVTKFPQSPLHAPSAAHIHDMDEARVFHVPIREMTDVMTPK